MFNLTNIFKTINKTEYRRNTRDNMEDLLTNSVLTWKDRRKQKLINIYVLQK